MQLEVLVEINPPGAIRPVEVDTDTPIATLMPTLLEEFDLPQMNVYGKPLVYMLRSGADRHILPAYTTLAEQEISPGSTLLLDSYVVDGTVAELQQLDAVRRQTRDLEPLPAAMKFTDLLHHRRIMLKRVFLRRLQAIKRLFLRRQQFKRPLLLQQANSSLFIQPPDSLSLARRQRPNMRRRALLAAGGVVTVGVGFVAYEIWRQQTWQAANMSTTMLKNFSLTVSTPPVQATKAGTTPTPKPTPPARPVPMTAKSNLVFTQHRGLVRTVSWSPNGMMLASGADDKTALIWGTDGTLQQKLLHADSVHTLAWSPDNQRLVTGTSNQVTFFRSQDGQALRSLQPTPTGMISELAWSPHGQAWVAASMTDTQAVVINPATYIIQTAFTGHTTSVEGVSWDASGQTVASCSMGGIIRVWNAATGQELHGYYQDGTAPTRAIAFAPTGTQLAVGSNDGVVHIWSGVVCQQQGNGQFGLQCLDAPLRLQATTQAIRALAWSPDARFLAVGSMDGLLSVWYPAQQPQKPLFTMQNAAGVRSIAWSPDGTNLASASGNAVTIWQLFGR